MRQPLAAPQIRSAPARSALCCALLLCLAAYAGAQRTTPGALSSLVGASKPASATPAADVKPTTPAEPSAPAAIPLPDVAARSEDLTRALRTIANELPTPDQLQAAQATLDDHDAELDARQKAVEAMLEGTPSTLELREEEHYWRNEQIDTAALRHQLLNWANAAQSAMQKLQTQLPVWQATLQVNEATPGLEPTVEVIKKALADLHRVNTQAQEQLKAIVNLQVRAAGQDQLALDSLDRISKTREYLDRKLFQRDSLPLWRVQQRRQMGEDTNFFVAASQRMLGIRAFAAQAKGALGLFFAVLLLSLLGAYRLHRTTRGVQPETPRQAEALRILRRWPALALLPPLLCAYGLAPLTPVPLIGLVVIVSFIPILSLLPSLIPARFRLLLYGMAAVYAVSAFVTWSSFSPFHKREMKFFISLAVLCVFTYLLMPSRLSRLEDGKAHGGWVFLIRVGVVLLGAAVFANLFGYVKLAQFLGVFCLYSTFIAISMLTGVRVFTVLLLEGIDSACAQQIAAVRQYHDAIARWGPRALQWSGIFLWTLLSINLLGLAPWINQQLSSIVDFRIAGGSTSITLGGVLGFFLILLVGYTISSAIRFILREELLSRLHLARGLPELIASTFHYLLLLLVFFFAVNAGGVELNKLTVLTGALGVGVGFGLQNIVNNFISGLILQFERPIHIGDVLDIDGTNGIVTRIGIRSSTIKTFQGAELIIPNGTFISGKVTNWTLTNPQRRVELPIGVAYGSDVKLVVRLLEQAATANENVLTSPAPCVYFVGFGDSSINFELRFWIMQAGNSTTAKSEVGLAAMDLLDQAGIEIPFPQRDLRLRAVNADAATMLLAANAPQSYADDLAGRELDPVLRRKSQQAGE